MRNENGERMMWREKSAQKNHDRKKRRKPKAVYVIMRCSDDLWINQWLKTKHIDSWMWKWKWKHKKHTQFARPHAIKTRCAWIITEISLKNAWTNDDAPICVFNIHDRCVCVCISTMFIWVCVRSNRLYDELREWNTFKQMTNIDWPKHCATRTMWRK